MADDAASEVGFAPQASVQRKSDEQEIIQVIQANYDRGIERTTLDREEDAKLLESKGFGVREASQFFLKDYEVLYLLFAGKMELSLGKKKIDFQEFVNLSLERDDTSWTRFLIFRDLRTRGYVVREGFGFPIDFRVYDRGDYGSKAAKYIVFGLNEGKTMSMGELRKNIEEMSTMGKEAVIAVVERRGEVIYYKVGKWHPVKPL